MYCLFTDVAEVIQKVFDLVSVFLARERWVFAFA